jgi:signal transduction histidine kinase
VADVLRAVDPARSCGGDGTPPVRIECHVDGSVTVETHATSVRRLLESLVRDAVAAAGRPDPDAATPPLREVVITSIDTGTALEIEVADSGPPRTVSSIDHGAAERLGGGLVVVPCAEGGTAVTLSLPRRVAMARAA